MLTKDETTNPGGTSGQAPAGQGTAQTQSGTASDGSGGSTSQAPKTYTDADIQKAVNDALAKAGRDAKAIEAVKKKVDADKEEIRQHRAQKDAAELEAVKNDPDKLNFYQRQKALKEREEALKEQQAQFESERTAHAEQIAKIQKSERSGMIADVAKEYAGSDPAKLEKLCDDLGVAVTADSVRLIAGNIWPKANNAPPPAPPVDGGSTMGGGGGLRDGMSMDEYANHPDSKQRYGKK